MQNRSLKQIRCAVIKNENESHDANVMAQLQNQRSLQSINEKKNKIQSFMNSTKLNASKIVKEQVGKKMEDLNAKMVMLQKQKEVKAKYTVVERKKQQPKVVNVQPTKVDWKKVDPLAKGVSVPVQKKWMSEESDEEGSGIDSEMQQTSIRTPDQLLKEREGVRCKMLNKLRQKDLMK